MSSGSRPGGGRSFRFENLPRDAHANEQSYKFCCCQIPLEKREKEEKEEDKEKEEEEEEMKERRNSTFFIVSLFPPFSSFYWLSSTFLALFLSILSFSLLIGRGRDGMERRGISFQSGSGWTNRWWTNQRRRIDQLVAGPPIKQAVEKAHLTPTPPLSPSSNFQSRQSLKNSPSPSPFLENHWRESLKDPRRVLSKKKNILSHNVSLPQRILNRQLGLFKPEKAL